MSVAFPLALSLPVEHTYGYELATHSRSTYSALGRSVLSQSSRIRQLGLTRGQYINLGNAYFDLAPAGNRIRNAKEYDWNEDKMPEFDDLQVRVTSYLGTPQYWLMSGAVREDDAGDIVNTVNHIVFRAQIEPRDDPEGNFNRYCNHFFDPVHNTALTASCFNNTYASAPMWAFGMTGSFSTPVTLIENSTRRNHFTLFDAREAMWRALTGRNKALEVKAPDESTRNAYWATTFRALGDILHLNQDMAQPQHTRDESHGVGHAAWYEKYIDGRAKGLTDVVYNYRFGEITAHNVSPLVYQRDKLPPEGSQLAYPIPSFPNLSDYWSTGLDSASLQGKGLADYSNRGFYTPGALIGNTRFSQPPADATLAEALYTPKAVTIDNITEVYYDGSVVDRFETPGGAATSNIHMYRASLIDDALSANPEHNPTPPSLVYSIDRVVFDSRVELLIPRAVAYSAGIINYFFRGTLDVSRPDSGVYALVDHAAEGDPLTGGFSRIKAKVANTSGEPMGNGVLVAVLKYHLNTCYSSLLTGAPPVVPPEDLLNGACRSADEMLVMSDVLTVDGVSSNPTELAFDFQQKLPISATDVYLQVVFRGTLGQEFDAVAVGGKDISEPSYFAYFNASDYIHLADSVYTRAEINASQSLRDKVRPTDCIEQTQDGPRLRVDCFNPFPINMKLSFATDASVQVTVSGLPAQRFARIAYLADAGVDLALAQVEADCEPKTPHVLTPLQWQADWDELNTFAHLTLPTMRVLRGIHGWYMTSCVNNGDQAQSTAPDNRAAVMSALQDETPFPVTVTFN